MLWHQATAADACLRVAVTGEDIGAVVHDVIALTIERRGQPPLRDGQANAVREPLTKRSSGDLDARRAPVLRMTGLLLLSSFPAW